ncbi:hypothetical protein K7X08_027106 [Anisodus acutangulus]|uniref:Uncharacterized protein n=1 Tax=Anisodus acutangulus TaxID=402998 RepID=A0A9Q1MLH4_9SOLA|nr:hypothetical protein K7X08_027106 [Anisodus acutangulus]
MIVLLYASPCPGRLRLFLVRLDCGPDGFHFYHPTTRVLRPFGTNTRSITLEVSAEIGFLSKLIRLANYLKELDGPRDQKKLQVIRDKCLSHLEGLASKRL